MRHSSLLTAMTCTAVVMAGCQQSVEIPSLQPQDGAWDSTVKIIAMAEAPETRSAFSWDDSQINDLQIIVTEENGEVVGSIYTDMTEDVEFRGVMGVTYEFRAVANVGHELTGSTLEEFLDHSQEVDFDDIEAKGIPMSCSEAVRLTIDKKMDTITIPLKRMLARIDFSIDRSRLTHADEGNGFIVKSVRIFNAINSYHPLSPVNRQRAEGTVDYRFDYADGDDISGLNHGQSISLYAIENMQGDLLPSNGDPWKKVPESIGQSDYCSYLEVEASYSAQGLSTDEITYRMYLGSNSTSNFDVRRNTIYRVTLIPTEDEIDGHRASWKIDSHDWNDRRSLSFNPNAIEIPSGGSGVTHVSMTPEQFEVLFSRTDWLQVVDCSFSYDPFTHDVTIISHSELSEDVSREIMVGSWDGRLSDICQVTIRKATNPVVDIYLKGPNKDGIYISDYSIVTEPGKNLNIKDAGLTYVFKDGTEHTVTSLDDEMLKNTSISLNEISPAGCYRYKDHTLSSDSYGEVGNSGILSLSYSGDEGDFTKDIDLLMVNREFVEFFTDYAHYVEVGDITYIHLYASYKDGFRFQPSKFAFDYIYLDIPEEYSHIAKATNYNASIAVEGLSIGTCPAELVFKTKSEPVMGFPTNKVFSLPTSIVVHDGGTMTLEPEYKGIKVGENYELVAKVYPDWNSDRFEYVTPEYVSSDESVAIVTEEGTVYGVGSGTAIISARFYGEESHFREFTCNALVKVIGDDIVTYSLEVTPEEVTMKEGETSIIKAILHTFTNGIDDGGRDVTSMCSWSSDDKEIARVALGTITAVATGSTTIEIEYNDMIKNVPVTVIGNTPDVPETTYRYELIIPENVTMGMGTEADVKAYLIRHTFIGEDESGIGEKTEVTGLCTWTSSDTEVVEIGETGGHLIAASIGYATVKASYMLTDSDTITSNDCKVRITGDSGLGVKIDWGASGSIINIGF